MIKHITTPLTKEKVLSLKAGDQVLLSGIIYTGRDAAHKRMIQMIEEGKTLPFDVDNQIIYYVVPTPPKPNAIFCS